MSFTHYTSEERFALKKLLDLGMSFRKIGQTLNRHHTNISREVYMITKTRDRYCPVSAHKLAQKKKCKARHFCKKDNKKLFNLVIKKLNIYSPDAIYGYLKRKYSDKKMQVSTPTIYEWIYADRKAGGTLYEKTHNQHKIRKKHRNLSIKANKVRNKRSIHDRPRDIEFRISFGHWEGDLVEGKKGTGFIMTHVERKSRKLMAACIPKKTSQKFLESTTKLFKKIPFKFKKTLTLDNGAENALHKEIEQANTMKVYFADTHSPWQRGSNEQMNGLLRRHFPKGMDFSTITQAELQRVVNRINNMPRKSLNYQTPNEVFLKATHGAVGT